MLYFDGDNSVTSNIPVTFEGYAYNSSGNLVNVGADVYDAVSAARVTAFNLKKPTIPIGYELKKYTVTFGLSASTGLTKETVSENFFVTSAEFASDYKNKLWVRELSGAATDEIVLDSVLSGIYAEGENPGDFAVNVTPTYNVKQYNITFNLNKSTDDLDKIVLGSKWVPSKENVTVLTENFCPTVYVWNSPSQFLKNYYGCSLTEDGATSSTLLADLVGGVTGSDFTAYVSWNVEDKIGNVDATPIRLGYMENEALVLYKNYSWYGTPTENDVKKAMKKAIAGNVTLSQNVDANVLIERAFDWNSFDPYTNLCSSSMAKELEVPAVDDTLTFKVSSKADIPGYSFVIKDFGYTGATGLAANPGSGRSWGMTVSGSDTTITINPAMMVNMYFLTESKALDYTINFASIKNAEGLSGAEVFVSDMHLLDKWVSSKVYNVTTMAEWERYFPVLYPNRGCFVWATGKTSSAAGSVVGYYFDDMAEHLRYDQANTLYPVLIFGNDYDPCEPPTTTYTLKTDGHGKLQFVQSIRVGENAYDEVVHDFVEETDAENGGETRLVLKVPNVTDAYDPDGVENAVFPVKIRAVPDVGYVVDRISYDIVTNGTTATIQLLDGGDDKIGGDDVARAYSVKFKALGPYYVAYDLSLESSDSSNVFFLNGAKPQQVIDLASTKSSYELMQPYNSQKCFVGWSFKSAARRIASDPVFKSVDSDLISDISSNEDSPTKLYAVWKDRVEGDASCGFVREGSSDYVGLYAAKTGDTGGILGAVTGGSIVLTQTYDGKLFKHPLSDEGVVIPNDEGYDFNVVVEPKAGNSFDGNLTQAVWAGSSSSGASEIPSAENGTYSVSFAKLSGETPYKRVFDAAFGKVTYVLEFDVNTKNTVYYNSEYWKSSVTTDNESGSVYFPEDNGGSQALAQTNECLNGWKLKNGKTAYSSLSSYNFASFMQEVNDVNAAILSEDGTAKVIKLYANWEPAGEGTCEAATIRIQPTVDAAVGSFVLSDGVNTIPVPAEGMVVPDQYTPKVTFVANAGITTGDVIHASANEVAGTNSWNFDYQFNSPISFSWAIQSTVWGTDEVKLSVDVGSETMKFAFNVNAGSDNVFYGTDWKKSGSYDLGMPEDERMLPSDIFRAEREFVGWAFAPNATSGFGSFTAETVAKVLSGDVPKADDGTVTLYAVWKIPEAAAFHTVIVDANESAGTLSLYQTIGTGDDSEDVVFTLERDAETGEKKLKVPSLDNGFDIKAKFTPRKGYNLDAKPIAVTIGENVNGYANESAITIAEDLKISASGTAEEIVLNLDVNVESDINVFYPTDWDGTTSLFFGNELPMGIYRGDAELKGWAFEKEGTYIFKKYDDAMYAAYNALKAMAGAPATLTMYAVWNTAAVPATYTVMNSDKEYGSLELSQEVNGAPVSYAVPENGALKVPVNANLEFKVTFTPKAGYSYGPLEVADLLGNVTEGAIVDNKITLSGNTLIIANAGLVRYDFKPIVNAYDSKVVFYGENWNPQSSSSFGLGDYLPTNVYRTDSVLAGWAFEADAVDGFDQITESMLATLDAKVAANPDAKISIYAVWKASTEPIATYTIKSANAGAGTLTLSQEDGYGVMVDHDVPAAGLIVPANRLPMLVKFAAADGYTLNEDGIYYTVDSDGNVLGTIENGQLTITGNANIKAPVTADARTLNFAVNTTDTDDLFYGDNWVESKPYDMSMSEDERTFPKLYRPGHKMVWGFASNATTGFEQFDVSFLAAYEAADPKPTTLYAVWTSTADVNYFEVSLDAESQKMGYLTLKRSAGEEKRYSVGASGLKVPNVALDYVAEFEVKEGFTPIPDLRSLKASGDVTFDGRTGKASFSGNAAFTANFVPMTYDIVFKGNSEGNVFFGSVTENVQMLETLPTDVYRTDACLVGWSFEPVDGQSYTEVDEDFVSEKAIRSNRGEASNVLYAVWAPVGEGCTIVNATVTNSDPVAGNLSLTHEGMTYDVGTGLEVPASVNGTALNLSFVPEFVPNDGFAFDGSLTVAGVDVTDGLVVNASKEVTIGVGGVDYEFSFNKNYTGDVFIAGALVTGKSMKLTDADKSLPMNLSRTDACLVGWSTQENATAGHVELTGALIGELATATPVNGVYTLFAVWNSNCRVDTYVITNANAGKGTFTLKQTNGGEYTVAKTMSVPQVAGLEFTVSFNAATGFAETAGASYVAKNEAGEVVADAFNGAVLTVGQNLSIETSLDPAGYVITFNENPATGDRIFYGYEWDGEESYNLNQDAGSRTLPTNIYQIGKVVEGWSLDADGTADYSVFSDAVVTAATAASKLTDNADGTKSITLYAIWKKATVATATVKSASASEGSMSIAQSNWTNDKIDVTADGVAVPKGNNDIKLVIDFTANDGYTYASESYFYSVDANGKNIAALTENDKHQFTVSGNMTIKAPVGADGYKFAFDVNAGTDNVFYGADWIAEKSFDIEKDEAELIFPENIYRAGTCFNGWAFTAGAGSGYKKFDESFAAAAKAITPAPMKLYAVWDASACTKTDVVVSAGNIAAGVITLKNGEKTYELDATGITVPAVAGISFAVSYETKTGYTAAEGAKLYYMNGAEKLEVEDATLMMSAAMPATVSLMIPVDAADDYKFVFNVNAAGANVFYGNDWKASETYNMSLDEAGRTLPAALYRTDVDFKGWALNVNASEGALIFDEALVQKIKAADVPVVDGAITLYAVWKTAEAPAFYTVTVDVDAASGSLELYQTVGSDKVKFALVDNKLAVPSAAAAKLNAKFTANDGFTMATNPILVAKGEAAAVAQVNDALITVDNDVTISVDVAAPNVQFALNENAAGSYVYYGASWNGKASVNMKTANVLPTNVYRADATLKGWGFTATASEIYTEYNAAMYAVYADKKAENPTADVEIFAIWDESKTPATYTVVNTASDKGDLTLSQTVNAVPYTYNVSESGLKIPTAADAEFSVVFTPKAGYSVNKLSATDMMGKEITGAITAGKLNLSGNTMVVATLDAESFEFMLDVHAGTSKVFYGEGWSASSSFNLGESNTLPANIYRTDSVLAGWSFSNAVGAVGKKIFDADMVAEYRALKAADPTATIYLYAIWGAGIPDAYTVKSADLSAGTLTLSQTIDGTPITSDVGADGLKIPVADDLVFDVSFTPATGWALAADGKFYTVDADGNTLNVLENNKLAAAAVTIKAPVTADGYTFAFDANAGDANVFYIGEKVASTKYDLSAADAEFPTNVVRAGTCLAGWKFTADGTVSYKKFDAAFVTALKTLPAVPSTLFAQWDATGCTQDEITIKAANVKAGSITLTHEGGVIDLDETGFKVPAKDGIQFVTANTVNAGFAVDKNNKLFYMDGATEVRLDDGVLKISATIVNDIALTIPANEEVYKFVFDVNAGNANVFYGAELPTSVSYDMTKTEAERTMPTEIYRAGKKLAGWSLSSNATAGSKVFNDAFIAKLKTADVTADAEGFIKLYAVWESSSDNAYTVTVNVANAASGSMVLYQVLDGEKKELALVNNQVVLPALAGLELAADFTVSPNFTLDGANPIVVKVGDVENSYANGSTFSITGDATISAKTATDETEFTFDANAGTKTVFYNGAKVLKKSYDIANGTEALPANLYSTEAKLIGWAFTEDATTGFTAFDNDFITAYQAAGSTTLFAVWQPAKVSTVAIINGEFGKGELKVTPAGETNAIVVPEGGLEVPLVEGGLDFGVTFTALDGYDVSGELAAYNQFGQEISKLIVDGMMNVAENVVVKSAVAAKAFVLKFNVNETDVFFAADWKSSDTYDVSEKNKLPNNIYHTAKTLVGWATTQNATEGTFVLDGEFSKSLTVAEEGNTLYAVWKTPEVAPATYTVKNFNAAAVDMTIKQVVEGVTYPYDVPATGLKIPAANGLEFTVSAAAKTGYTLIDDGDYYSVDASGKDLAVLASAKFTTSGDINIKAPVSVDGYKFAFNVNAGEGKDLFYGDAWQDSGSFDISLASESRAFPTAIYRPGFVLVGWGMTADAAEANTFTAFDDAFVSAIKSAASVPKTLYAFWKATAEENFYMVELAAASQTMGTLTLTRNVGTEKTYDVGAAGLMVPNVGLDFVAKYEAKSGYVLIADSKPLSATGLTIADDGAVELTTATTFTANYTADAYELVFDMNAGDKQLFYGDAFAPAESYKKLESLPAAVYRTDACLVGWAFDAAAETGFAEVDDGFIAARAAAVTAGLNGKKLYAVWKEAGTAGCAVVTAKVTNSDKAAGSIKLTRTVNGSPEVYEVGDGLEIPASVNGTALNLNFVPVYTANKGYTYNGSMAIGANDVTAGFAASASGVIVADVTSDSYKFVFSENADGVFYSNTLVSEIDLKITDADKALPTNLYRADACFIGWSVSETAAEGYKELNESLIADLASATPIAGAYTLHAVWDSKCKVETVTLYNGNSDKGSYTLKQDDGRTFTLSSSLVIPKTASGVKFTVDFTPATGFVLAEGYSYAALDGLSNPLDVFNDDVVVVDQTMFLVVDLDPAGYVITLDVNTSDRIFYGSAWTGTKPYNLDQSEKDRTLPTNIYQTTKVLAGWSLTSTGTADYSAFNNTMVDAAVAAGLLEESDDGIKNITLYAIWKEEAAKTVTLKSASATEGTMKITQSNWATDSIEVTADGIAVPAGNNDVEFKVSYVANTGYTYSAASYFYSVDEAGENIAALTGAKFVASDMTIKAPVAADGYTFAFDENASGANVFYTADLPASGTYDVSMDAESLKLPKDVIYRAGTCHVGWSLDAKATAGAFDFDTTLAVASKALAQPIRLYAVWSTTGCTQKDVVVKAADVAKGTVTLTHAGKPYELDETGLAVPAVAGINFAASYTVNAGYTVDEGGKLFYMSGSEKLELENETLTMAASMTEVAIAIPAEESPAITIAFNTNAGNANVFYGESWRTRGEFSVNGENLVFPTEIYRTDAVLKGWSLSAKGTETFNKYDADFIKAVIAAQKLGLEVNTLYAVWETSSVATAEISLNLKNENSGSMTLTQTVGEDAEQRFDYKLAAGQKLVVPVVETGLNFNVHFDATLGFDFDGATPIVVNNALGAKVSAIDDGDVLNVKAASVLFVTLHAPDELFSLRENVAEDVNVFYGEGWNGTATVDVDSNRALPMNIYRGDATLVGWALTANASEAEAFTEWNAAALAKRDSMLSVDMPVGPLYAVWKIGGSQTVYTVTSADVGNGVLTLTQTVDGESHEYVVGQNGLKVPAAATSIPFALNFSDIAVGYEWDNEDPTFRKVVGTEKVAIANALLKVEGNVVVAAPIKQPAFRVVFDSYTAEDQVFFGNSWKNFTKEATFDVSATAGDFPMDLYRTNACIEGWTIDGATVAQTFTKFNADFIKAVRAVDPDGYDVTVHAKWNACSPTTYAISQSTAQAGYMELVQYGEKNSDGIAVELTRIRLSSNDETVVVPKGNGDVSFNVEYFTYDGYSKDEQYYVYAYNAAGKLLTSVTEGEEINFVSDTKLKAGVSADHYTFAFDLNAGNANVFFNSLWKKSAEYDMDMDEDSMAFPKAFRADACLAGWSFEKVSEANISGVEYFESYTDGGFIQKLDAAGSRKLTLYAVWNKSCEHATATISVADAAKGSVTLVNGGYSYVIGKAGLVVPVAENGIEFSASYTVATGYSASEDAKLFYELDGEKLTVENGVLNVQYDSDIALNIPAAADEAMTLVFDVNAGNANVFYGDTWNGKGEYSMDGENTAFPTEIYRTDAKLTGWALSKGNAKAYTVYDADFIVAVKSMEQLGMKTGTLYAVWDEYAVVDVVRLSSGSEDKGAFTVTQTVGRETFRYTVDGQGMNVPATESGLTFNVEFVSKPGYTLAAGKSLKVDGAITTLIENGGSFSVSAQTVLTADATADGYHFAFDVNAGNANVFYGDSWSSKGTFDVTSADSFPTVLYQSNKKLLGWSLEAEGGEVYTDLTEELVKKLPTDSATLYAVWEDAPVETYTVSFANSEVGELTLAQIVENDTIVYQVGEDGLNVPVIDGGFNFKVAFIVGSGYSLLASADELYTVDENGNESSIENNEIKIEENVTIAVPVGVEKFKLVFNVNTDRKDLIYGEGWISADTYSVDKNKEMPRYVYASDACVAGWTFAEDTTVYTSFDTVLVAALKNGTIGENGYVMDAKWIDSKSCSAGNGMGAYDMLKLSSEHGAIEFLETRENDAGSYTIAHTFANDKTMLLPHDFAGTMLTVRSIPDSSFVMDSLVMRRSSDANEMVSFKDGSALVYYLYDGEFTAHYSKSNKTDLKIADLKLEQSGNAIRLSFATSEFEVTRGVEARVFMMDAHGNVVADTVLVDSIPSTPYNLNWSMFPVKIGDYSVFAELTDGSGTVSESREFSVEAAIASVGKDSWQMVSMATVDTAAMEWDDDVKFYWWDEVGEPGEFWQYKEFAQHGDIVAERGYWYSSLEGRPLALNPEAESAEGDITWKLDSLYSGWNLVANPYGWSLNLFNDHRADVTDVDQDSKVKFWRYNAASAEYEEALVLKPFEAVWAQVGGATDWTLKGTPEFESDLAVHFPEIAPEVSGEGDVIAASKRRALAKANGKGNWSIQAILSDANGKKDSWNILGVSDNPFVSEEPPAAMGDHVTLAIVDGKKFLAKSFKKAADSYEWEIALNATSERLGELSFAGVNAIRSLGYHVYVTVGGKTTEVMDSEKIRVALKTSTTKATVRVSTGKMSVVVASLDGLRMTQAAGKLNVSFNVDEKLAGSRTVVDVVNLDGKVVATYNSKAEAGSNMLRIDAPRSGIYMLRVRVASQQVAGKIMVK